MINHHALLSSTIASSRNQAAPASPGSLVTAMVFDAPNDFGPAGGYHGVCGNVKKGATSGPFGGPCAEFGTTGPIGFINSRANSTMVMGAEDFTVECWIAGGGSEPAAVSTFMSNWSLNSAYRAWVLNYDPATNRIQFQCRTTASSTQLTAYFAVSDPTAFFNGTWHHVAAERIGTVITIYVDGVAGGTTIAIGANTIPDPGPYYRAGIGCVVDYYPKYSLYSGKIAEYRVTRGSTRYGGAFTPPSAPFPYESDDPQWDDVLVFVNFSEKWGFQLAGPYVTSAADIALPITTTNYVNTGHIINSGLHLAKWAGSTGAFLASITSDFDFSSGDFTLEVILCAVGGLSYPKILGFMDSGAVSAYIQRSSSPSSIKYFLSYNGTDIAATLETTGVNAATFPDYSHIAITKEGNTLREHFNGALAGSLSGVGDFYSQIGRNFTILKQDANYGMRGFRLTKGAALYGAGSFTPPNASDFLVVT